MAEKIIIYMLIPLCEYDRFHKEMLYLIVKLVRQVLMDILIMIISMHCIIEQTIHIFQK